MRLTKAFVQKFIGGQMFIRNDGKGSIHLGELDTITVLEEELHVVFKWFAAAVGFPPQMLKYIRDDCRTYKVSLEFCDVCAGDVGGVEGVYIQHH